MIFASQATVTLLGSPLKRPSTFPPSEARPGLLEKADVPILVTEFGIVIEVN